MNEHEVVPVGPGPEEDQQVARIELDGFLRIAALGNEADGWPGGAQQLGFTARLDQYPRIVTGVGIGQAPAVEI